MTKQMKCLNLLLFCVSIVQTQTQIISVIKTAAGDFQVNEGLVENWIVRANFTEAFSTTGWNFLDIESNEYSEDVDQAKAAGIAEGYLTSSLILQYHREFIEKPFCWKDATFCEWAKNTLQTNKAWVLDMINLHSNSDYWNIIRLFYAQLEGLERGIKQKMDFGLPKFTMELDLSALVMMANFYPDLGDYVNKYKSDNIQISRPSCSVLIKETVNNLIASHSTWHDYKAIPFRIMKRYSLKYVRKERGLIPGHTISMSSYAGLLYSLDDFYQISSGLSVMETTLPIYNNQLYNYLDPTKQLLTPVRAMVANRLSMNSRDWCELFKDFNSGTYNNQWLIIDYKKSVSDPGLLYILEQLPRQILYEDVTQKLRQSGYWASYNRAYFPTVFQKSGAQDMNALYGDWFSYEKTARANIFRSTHNTVTDKTSMYSLVRFNDFMNSSEGRPPGCNGSIPSAAISARNDLQDPQIGCSWGVFDQMEGRRNYGAIDVKIIDRSDMKTGSMFIESGPTHFNLKPFSWSNSESTEQPSLYREIKTYNFSGIQISWPSLQSDSSTKPSNQKSSSNNLRLNLVLNFTIIILCIFS